MNDENLFFICKTGIEELVKNFRLLKEIKIFEKIVDMAKNKTIEDIYELSDDISFKVSNREENWGNKTNKFNVTCKIYELTRYGMNQFIYLSFFQDMSLGEKIKKETLLKAFKDRIQYLKKDTSHIYYISQEDKDAVISIISFLLCLEPNKTDNLDFEMRLFDNRYVFGLGAKMNKSKNSIKFAVTFDRKMLYFKIMKNALRPDVVVINEKTLIKIIYKIFLHVKEYIVINYMPERECIDL